MNTTKYKHIAAWGKILRSNSYYIELQIEKAKQDNAPANAIYKSSDCNWRTADEIVRDDLRAEVNSIANSY